MVSVSVWESVPKESNSDEGGFVKRGCTIGRRVDIRRTRSEKEGLSEDLNCNMSDGFRKRCWFSVKGWSHFKVKSD